MRKEIFINATLNNNDNNNNDNNDNNDNDNDNDDNSNNSWAAAAAADPSWDSMSGERESRGRLCGHIARH